MLQPFLRAVSKTVSIEYVGGYKVGFVGGTTDQTITFGGNLTGGTAASASENDIVVVYVNIAGSVPSPAARTITGYSIIGFFNSESTFGTTLAVYAKLMGATPDSSFVVVGGTGSSSNGGALAVEVWRNVDPNSLFFNPITSRLTNTAKANPAAITPTVKGSYILAGGGASHSQGTATFTSSDLTNFLTASVNETQDPTIGLGYYQWTSGSFDAAQFGFTGTDSTTFASAAITMSLAPKNSSLGLDAFVGSTNKVNTSASTTLVLDKPSGVVQNDLMIIVFSSSGSGTTTITAPTGWTQAYSRSGNGNFTVLYKTAGSSEPSTYTITFGTSLTYGGGLTAFRGYAWDTIGTVNTTASTSMTASAITVASNNSFLLAIGSGQSGTAMMFNNLDYIFNRSASGPTHAVCGKKVNSGSSGSVSFSFAAASNNTAVLVSIKPV